MMNSKLAREMDEAEKEYLDKYGIDPEYTAQFDAKQAKRTAADEQEAAAMRKAGRWQVAYASCFVAENSTANFHTIYQKLYEAIGARELEAYEPGNPVPYTLKGNWPDSLLAENAMHLEVYWDDLNKWLKKNLPRLPETCKFPEPDAPAAKVKPVPITAQQNEVILKWLRDQKYDPLKLPVPPSGKAGVKKLCRDAIKFSSPSVFNTAWDRLRSDGAIKDEK